MDFGDDAGANGLAALADGEAHALSHRHRHDKLAVDLSVVAGHHHLSRRRQIHCARHVRRAEEELRPQRARGPNRALC
eukprot:1242838-Pleurochrysis_carterae.AAC.2